jgi:hypothetical protein
MNTADMKATLLEEIRQSSSLVRELKLKYEVLLKENIRQRELMYDARSYACMRRTETHYEAFTAKMQAYERLLEAKEDAKASLAAMEMM